MRPLLLVISLLALGVIVPVGAGASAPDPCTGITGCVVAPAQPVAVAVGLGPVAYTIACPVGTTAVSSAATTQAGTYAVQATVARGPLAMQESAGSITWSGMSTIATAASPAVTLTTGSFGAPLVQYQSGGIVPGGAGSGTLPAASALATLASGVAFTASLPPFPEGVTLKTSQWNRQWGWYVASATSGVDVVAAATFTPQVGCVAVSRAQAVAASTHRTVEFDVRRGVQTHRIWCPAGTARHGAISHAVFLEGRATLSRAERRAIASRYVADGAGRAHVETRIGSAAPAGLRVQLHADCVPTA